MLRPTIRLLAILIAVAAAAPVHGGKLTKVEIAQRGKAAAVIVQLHPAAIAGTAFGVQPSGYFVTAERVFSGKTDDAEATLVVDPGLKSQRVVKGRLVRRDRELGLALLRVSNVQDLPTLPLGSADAIAELTELVTFGFPNVLVKSPEKPEFPFVNVNVSTVTSLTKKSGSLVGLDLKAGPKLVQAGGPVLDENGNVVGVTVTSSRELMRVVTVNQLVRFLSVPEFHFTPPVVTRANEHAPADFQVRVESVIPPAKPLSVALVLRAGDEPERAYPLLLKDGVYRQSAVPVPLDVFRRLDVTAHFDAGFLAGYVTDRVFQIGAEKIKLSTCSRLQLLGKPMAVLSDGKTIEGPAAGLEQVDFLIGGQKATINLHGAKTVQVVSPRPPAAVDCTLIARQGGQEVGRYETRFRIRGVSLYEHADPSRIVITPPALADAKAAIPLTEPAADICVGGGGRYLVVHLPKAKKLAIFDVSKAEIVRHIPLTEEKIAYAAGLDQLVVGLTNKNIVERWNLHTGEKELSRILPPPGTIQAVILGSASLGPVAINGVFHDLATLKPVPIKTPKGSPGGRNPVSADGMVFGGWNTNLSPGTSTTFVLLGDELKRYDEGAQGHVVPGPDGRAVYTAGGVRGNLLQRLSGTPTKPSYFLPAVHGHLYLGLTSAAGKNKGGGLAVHTLGREEPLWYDPAFAHGIPFDGWDRDAFGAWKRIFFIPHAKLIVLLPPGNDRLELRRFDIEALLEKGTEDYLLITSNPPAPAKRGAAFKHQLLTKTRKGEATYLLASGPEGLTVTPGGLLQWQVPIDAAETPHDVSIAIRAAGQELEHRFALRLMD